MVKCRATRISKGLSDKIDELSLRFGIPKTTASELIISPRTEHFIMERVPKSRELELKLFTMRKIKVNRGRK